MSSRQTGGEQGMWGLLEDAGGGHSFRGRQRAANGLMASLKAPVPLSCVTSNRRPGWFLKAHEGSEVAAEPSLLGSRYLGCRRGQLKCAYTDLER